MQGAPYPDWLLERFWSKVEKTDSCWLWKASTTQGYGQFGIPRAVAGRATVVRAHRIVYFHVVGPIPNGLHLDHLCRNRACVNPDHLEPVTPGENVRRGEPATKTRCVHGHDLSGTNLYVGPDGRRQCRTCRRDASERFKDAHPEYYNAEYWREYRRQRASSLGSEVG